MEWLWISNSLIHICTYILYSVFVFEICFSFAWRYANLWNYYYNTTKVIFIWDLNVLFVLIAFNFFSSEACNKVLHGLKKKETWMRVFYALKLMVRKTNFLWFIKFHEWILKFYCIQRESGHPFSFGLYYAV